jgi:methionine-rich copper-binding protein CopC
MMRRRLFATFAFLCALVATGGPVSAHAFLRVADPAEDSTVNAAPVEIRLAFTEPVEIRFSIFKVYRLDANPSTELRRLNAAAGALTSDVLTKRDDESARADAGVSTTARTATDITLRLKPDTQPGVYAVMWRVLSVDTHTTQGFHIFIIAPRR